MGWDEQDAGETIGVLVVYAEMYPEIERISRRKPMTKDEMLEIMWASGFDTVDVGAENETPPMAYVPVGIILRHGKHNAVDASRSDWCDDIAIALNESSFENPKPWNNILYKRDAVAIGRSLEIYDTYADYFKVSVKDMYEDTVVAVTTTDSSFANCFSPGIKIAGGALKNSLKNSEDVVIVRNIDRIGRLCGYLFDKFDREAEKQLKVIVYLINPYTYDKMFDTVMFDPYCSAYFARLVCMYDMRRGYVTCAESQCSYLDRISIRRR